MIDRILNIQVPRWSVFLLDTMIIVFSIVTAYMLRFNFHIPQSETEVFRQAFVIILFTRIVGFLLFRLYSGIIQYTSTRDASRIFLVVLGGSFVFSLGNIISYETELERFLIPYSIIIIEFITSLMFLVGYRVFVKIAYIELSKPHSGFVNVMIFGAGEAGDITKRALETDTHSKVRIIGFIDDAAKKANKRMGGLLVYPSADLLQIFKDKQVERLILAVQNLPVQRKQELIDLCMEADVEVLSVPPVTTWINGELSVKQIRSVRIEDLLNRNEIVLNEEQVKVDLRGKTVLITGAAGSIGSELVNQVSRFQPQKLLLVDQAESPLFHLELQQNGRYPHLNTHYIVADVTNQARMNVIFERFRPDYVFHAAAYKHVPMMEKNPLEAVWVNVLGTRNLANLAIRTGVHKFVMISTDKAVNPTNVMGASKRMAEIYVQSRSNQGTTQFITTRFGNVLGSNGSVIPLFEKQIAKGGPVTVTHPDITRYFMTIPEACRLVLEAGSMGNGGEIFVFDMGQSVKIVDLAKQMIRLSGLQLGKDIEIEFTGLRPGEKLYEELLASEESTLPTHHNKILKAQVSALELNEVDLGMEQMEKLLASQDVFGLVGLLKMMIPEYKSGNSEFSILDTVSPKR